VLVVVIVSVGSDETAVGDGTGSFVQPNTNKMVGISKTLTALTRPWKPDFNMTPSLGYIYQVSKVFLVLRYIGIKDQCMLRNDSNYPEVF